MERIETRPEVNGRTLRSTPAGITLVCPACRRTPISAGITACAGCGQAFAANLADTGRIDVAFTEDVVNQHTEAAYRIYSKFYAPFALLAYWLVWRGKFLRHLAFFRGILTYGRYVVDVATGDGSLTALALFKPRIRANRVLAIDISGSMLEQARRKLPARETVLIRGDVMRLPLADRAVRVMSCFGGLNSFPSGEKALQEMARVLAPGGVIRGSVLLLPETPWRRKLVMEWIGKGYQSEVVDDEIFARWIQASGLNLVTAERHGDALLFELRKYS